MKLEDAIRLAIESEALKLANRFQNYHNSLHLSNARQERILGHPVKKEIRKPSVWNEDKKFDPFYVLKNAKAIARSATKKILSDNYTPKTPSLRKRMKTGGGEREIRIYQIPDAAISNFFYKNLLAKNKHRFSAFSYAYRKDKNVHFAIQDISLDLRYYSRLFVAEFDFSDFFGSLNHEFLLNQLVENGFYVTDIEKSIIRGFMSQMPENKGIPQGTSISLFLANIACWRLDRSLEEIGVKFARYADDTVVWTRDYEKVCRAYQSIESFSSDSGAKINFLKSEGISLLTTAEAQSEFRADKHHLDFLGYKLGIGKTSIKTRNLSKIKKQISYLLYKNLIHPLKQNHLLNIAIPANGKDENLLIAMSQIRRYLYGNLNEISLRKIAKINAHQLSFKGIMSFFPLVDDEDQLRDLDRWLCRTIYMSVRRRGLLWSQKWGHARVVNQFPFNVLQKDIVPSFRRQRIGLKRKRLLEIPSFLRIYRALQKKLLSGGIEATINPRSDLYTYE